MAKKENEDEKNIFGTCRAITVLAAPIVLSLALNIVNSYMAIWWIGQYFPVATNSGGNCPTNSSCAYSPVKVYISAVGLSNLSYNVAGISIIYGLSSGLQVLMAQAHGAGGDKRDSKAFSLVIMLQRIHIQRTAIVLLIASIPLCLMNLFLTPVSEGKKFRLMG